MIDAFIFDMDGTLIDTEILWVEAFERYVLEQGLSISRAEATAIVYGIPNEAVHAALCRRFPALNVSLDAMNAGVRPIFTSLRASRDVRIPGSVRLLERLAESFPVAIVSGSGRGHVDHGVRLTGVGPRLAFTLSGDDYAPGKPDPAGYAAAAARFGLPPGRCLAFEDSAAGVASAKGAGMHCVALTRPDRPAQDVSEADLTLEDLSAFSLDDYLAARVG